MDMQRIMNSGTQSCRLSMSKPVSFCMHLDWRINTVWTERSLLACHILNLNVSGGAQNRCLPNSQKEVSHGNSYSQGRVPDERL